MPGRRWWRGLRDWWRKRGSKTSTRRTRPLREFIYLDEVSLTSLLVSQRDTIPEHVTSGRSISEQAEISARASVDAVAAKAGSATRYQTANSSSVESSRKAVVQTLFNEFRDGEDLPIGLTDDAEGTAELPGTDGVRVWPVEDLTRGQLIEIEVVLDADPVYKLGTMVSEFSAMAADYPQMAGHAGLARLEEVAPVNKVLDRLMAGLIPIRAHSSNFSVVAVDNREFIIRNIDAGEHDLVSQPLEVVGVTEHIGYWKDIRRVLFSSGQFKLLCRLARPGVHDTWTPVKVAHLFGDIAPTLVERIEAAGKAGTAGRDSSSAPQPQFALLRALALYADAITADYVGEVASLSPDELTEIASEVVDVSSPSAQRQAFADVKSVLVERNADFKITPEEDLAARRHARQGSNLSAFAGSTGVLSFASDNDERADEPDGQMEAKVVDVEVVAIYW